VLSLTAVVIVAGALAFAPAPPDKPDNTSDERNRRLDRRRRNELESVRDERLEEFRFGVGTFYQAVEASRRLMLAELALAETPKQRIAAHAAHLDLVRLALKVMLSRFEAGRITEAEYLDARTVWLGAKTGWLMASGKFDFDQTKDK
jgi:hypothetical protein